MMPTFFPLVIDSTMMSELADCEMAFFRRYLQHLNGEESTDLIAGGAFAKGMEVARKLYYNEGADPWEAVDHAKDALHVAYGDHVPREGSTKTVEKLQTALELYFMQYPLGNDLVVPAKLENGEYAIEYSFAHELPLEHPDIPGLPIIFAGRLDMLGIYAGKLWGVDEKSTAAAFTKNWPKSWDTRGQFTAYTWGLRKDNIPMAGALIRGVYLGKSKIDFQEAYTTRSEFMIDIWYSDMMRRLERVLESYKKFKAEGGHPSKYFSGSWSTVCTKYNKICFFSDMCRDKTSETFLVTQFDQNIWLPHLHKRVPLNSFLEEIGYVQN